MSWSASMPKGACTCSISGASARRRTNGSRRSAISCANGSRSAGRKSRGRSSPASARSSTSACGSARSTWRASSLARAATRRCARNRSAAAWRWKVCTCRPARPGSPTSAQELLSFPAGRHDDQVDALGLVGQLLDRMFAPGRPRTDAKPAARSLGDDERRREELEDRVTLALAGVCDGFSLREIAWWHG